jgi:hypothetical protein
VRTHFEKEKRKKEKLTFQDNTKKCLSMAIYRGWRFSKNFCCRNKEKNFLINTTRPLPSVFSVL